MKKIPTMFRRDPATDLRHVMNEIMPGCEWVLAGEGRATRKFDGTCVMIRGGKMFKRREVKQGKTAPADFELVETDEKVLGDGGKAVGWVPVGDGLEDRYHREAFDTRLPDGTYELCGLKIQGNPERFDRRVLVRHGIERLLGVPRDFDGLAIWLPQNPYEGVVFHHEDGRMAKIKERDFPTPTPANRGT